MRKLLSCLIGTTLLLAACSSAPGTDPGDDPEAALIEALEALSQADGVTEEISLQSTPESLAAASEGDINEETAAKILDSSVVISAKNTGSDVAEAQSQILVRVAGNDDVELRVVDNSLYLRADIKHILETFGQDPGQADTFAAQAQGQPGFEWVQAAVAGEWLVLKNLQQLTQQLGVNPAPDQKKLINGLLDVVKKNATVSNEGDEDPGTHLVATMPLRATAEDLVDVLQSAGTQMPPGATSGMSDIPEGDLTVDFWVEDGQLTQMEIDFLQFAKFEESGEEIPEGVDELGMLVTFEEFTGSVEAVADALELDPAAISQAFAGDVRGTSSESIPAEFDCSQLKGAPPEVIELYAAECPELQK